MYKQTWLDKLAYRILEAREELEIEEREDLKSKGQERCTKCGTIGEIGKDCKCNPFSQPSSLDNFED